MSTLIYPKPGFVVNPQTNKIVKIDGATGQAVLYRHSTLLKFQLGCQVANEIETKLPHDMLKIIIYDYCLDIEERYNLVCNYNQPFESVAEEVNYWKFRQVRTHSIYAYLHDFSIAILCKSKIFTGKCWNSFNLAPHKELSEVDWSLREFLDFDRDETFTRHLYGAEKKKIMSIFKYKEISLKQAIGMIISIRFADTIATLKIESSN
jgi:hypothetical protein